MEITWLDSNSWLIAIDKVRVLVDPWLVGPLVFGGAEWLFKAERTIPRPIPDRIDLILLSQGLPDHAHPPTLEVLDRAIPVVGSPGAAKVCQQLGYTNVHVLNHGQRIDFKSIPIEALPGAPVGPSTLENAYIINDKIYYEPHGFPSDLLARRPPIDVVITPIIDLVLPFVGRVIQGRESAVKLCQWLQPQILLPTAAGGALKAGGFLLKILRAEGSAPEMQATLKQQGLGTIVREPKSWEPFLV